MIPGYPGIKKSRDQKSRDFHFQKIPGLINPGIFRMEKSRDQKIPGLKFSKNPGTKKSQKSRPVHTSTWKSSLLILHYLLTKGIQKQPSVLPSGVRQDTALVKRHSARALDLERDLWQQSTFLSLCCVWLSPVTATLCRLLWSCAR